MLLLLARPALAQSALDLARAAIGRGDIAAGEQILNEIDESRVDRNDLDFLKGTAALARNDADKAIARFKTVLDRDGSLNRVRLDLARAYFLKGDDVAAEHHFRAAMAQGVPPEVQANIDRYLDAIRRRKHWDITVQAALVPDSNINAATTSETVTLFGLPFQLDPNARRKSGVGVSGSVAGDYQWDVSQNVKLRSGAALYDIESSDSAFSDRSFSVTLGPRWLLGPGREVSVLATGGRRWLGGHVFSDAAGGRIEGQVQFTPRVLLGAAVFGQSMQYAGSYSAYSGPVFGGNATLTYAFDQHSFVRAIAGIVREQASADSLRDTQYALGLGYYRDELPGRFAAYAEVRATDALTTLRCRSSIAPVTTSRWITG
ncbi:MAG: tetratricopeptide repeat protein [Candidatus Binataceae bacterium]